MLYWVLNSYKHSVKFQQWCTIFASQMETGSEQELINMHIKTEGYASEPSPLLKLFSIKFQSAWLPLGKNGFSDSKFISRSNLFSAPLIFSKVNGKKKKKVSGFPVSLTKSKWRKRREGTPFILDHPLLAITDNRELPIKLEFQSTTKQTPTEEHTGETWTDKTEDNHMAALNDPINTRKVWCF